MAPGGLPAPVAQPVTLAPHLIQKPNFDPQCKSATPVHLCHPLALKRCLILRQFLAYYQRS